MRRGLQRLDGRRVVRRQRRPPDPALPGPAVGRRAGRRRGAPQRGPGRAGRCVLRAARRGWASPASTPGTGTRSSPRAETGTVRGDAHRLGHQDDTSSDDAPDAVQAVEHVRQQRASMIDFLFSGVCALPRLKLLYAEAQIGWIPYVLERVDDVWEVHRGWSDSQATSPIRPRSILPTDRGCFFKDGVGIENLDRVGAHNIAFETDYPHQDRTWPNTHQVAKELFGQLDAETVHKIVRGNAIRLLELEGLGEGTTLRPAVTTLDPAATTVVEPARCGRGSNGCWARSASPPTGRRSSPTTWSRPTCAASTRTASHLMALYCGRVRRPPPSRHQGHDARRRGLDRAARRRPRFRPGRRGGRVDLAVERAHEHGVATVSVRELTHLGALATTPCGRRRGLLAMAFQNGAMSCRPSAGPPACSRPTRSRTRCPPARNPPSSTTSPPLRRPGTRSCWPASAATRPSPRAGPTTSTAPDHRPQAASVFQLQWFGGHKGFGLGFLVESSPGVLADSCYGATENTASELAGGTASPRAPVRGPRRGAYLPSTEFRARVDRLIADVHASGRPPASSGLVPGELEAERRRGAWRRASRSRGRSSTSSTGGGGAGVPADRPLTVQETRAA